MSYRTLFKLKKLEVFTFFQFSHFFFKSISWFFLNFLNLRRHVVCFRVFNEYVFILIFITKKKKIFLPLTQLIEYLFYSFIDSYFHVLKFCSHLKLTFADNSSRLLKNSIIKLFGPELGQEITMATLFKSFVH